KIPHGDARDFAANFCTVGLVSSKALRMRRLFGADGRLLLVAMDHAGFMGPVPGLDLPTMAAVVAAGADAVMTTYGTARRASQQPAILGQAALVLSLGICPAEPEEQVLSARRLGGDRAADDNSLLRQVRDALDAGASGVAFGRNIWSHTDPAAITRRLLEVVHPRAARAAEHPVLPQRERLLARQA